VKKISIVLADDHTILRNRLRIILNQVRDFKVVGEAENGRECLEMVEELSPDILLMDISMPGLNSLEATRDIKRRYPKVKVIILGVYATEEYVYQLFSAGALGYLLKKAAQTDLVNAIRIVYGGGSFLSPAISENAVLEYIARTQELHCDDSYDFLTKRKEMHGG